jgi:hypothetical protein
MVQHFRLWGEFTLAIDMVWLYRSPIPGGGGGNLTV